MQLEDIWRHEVYFKLLKTFAALKYSEENILFIEAVRDCFSSFSFFLSFSSLCP